MNERRFTTRGADDVHPDQGTIHAWLEGSLDSAAATRTEAHAAECALCSARVAEARGLIAGASRVAGLLDEVPPPIVRPTPAASPSTWRTFRVTPARAVLTAALVVTIGVVLTRRHGAVERIPAPDAMAPAAERPIPPMSDSLLRSAIAARLRQEQPPRVVEPVRGLSPLTCMQVEASSGFRARLGEVSPPFVLAYDSIALHARILTPDGKDTHAKAVVTHSDNDSVALTLEGARHTVYMSFTGGGPVRSGAMAAGRSATAPRNLPVTARAVNCPGR
ncbi:MAG TPA: hypothetical protein VF929_08490 [Gemmatimonadaceae bacterium]